MDSEISERKYVRVICGGVKTDGIGPRSDFVWKGVWKEVDVWSLGCIFAGMLEMIRDNAQEYMERYPLFPEKSCYPLSPDLNTAKFRPG